MIASYMMICNITSCFFSISIAQRLIGIGVSQTHKKYDFKKRLLYKNPPTLRNCRGGGFLCWNSFYFANIIPMYLQFERTIWQFIIKSHETDFQKGIKKKKKN